MSGYLEIILDQGTDFSYQLLLTDDVSGNTLNLVGYIITSNARSSYYNLNAAIAFTTTLVDPANGNVTIGLDSGNTALVAPGRYYYDVKMKSPANLITRIIEGIVTVTGEQTF